MKILSHTDIMSLNINPIECYQWVENMLRNKERTILPPKISIKPSEDVFYNVMPSLITDSEVGGLKVVTRYPNRMPTLDSQIMLFDYSNGELKALLDGNFITTMRTGAVAAHSVKLFAKKKFSKVGLIGLGNQTRATIRVLLSLYPNKRMTLRLMKYKNQHELFVDYIRSLPNAMNIDFEFCDTYESTVRGSEVIISSVTYFAHDVCGDACFEEGCLVIPIHTRGFMNCDLFFDKVFADDTEHVNGFKYFNQFKRYAEVTDVVNRKVSGRENEKERIIVYNIGLSIHDVNFAEKIYRIAENRDVGLNVEFQPPSNKFWI
ncbi:ornithine cyclodeaminase [Paenibacillus nanensis]|uniref:Ornithine cyclodeaminase n=1 Tax=Paenibacillus nanensis TaxID=393251 RepID=A0A3A1UPF7_9BACL|nr:ornithine cyclodeaminase [Paenibacillus nanensis]RIX45865.1 ornithine cyclodeaminase [Paenibacillus nanensis]